MEISKSLWLILFIIWGIPLGYYRSKFRKLVYQTDSWTINIKPLFWLEIKGLFGNLYPENKRYIRSRNFYLFYLLVYFILFIVYFNTDTMNVVVGSKVPSFELKDQQGELFNLETVRGKKNLVIYFYPKDDSPGCTKQACAFRDQFAVFEEADALVIGISAQSVESHLEFATKHRLNYLLLSDSGNKVRKLFGVPSNLFGMIPGRVTYVVNKKGEVVYLFNSQINAEQHVEEAVRILKSLQ
ncbi:MAG: peroxiredoxin [Phocaeicola sp.]